MTWRPVLTLGLVLLLAGRAVASAPELPPNEGGQMLSLSVAPISPGSSGSLDVTLSDPLNVSLESIVLTLQVYRWTQAGGGSQNLSSSGPSVPQLALPGGAASRGVVWQIPTLGASKSSSVTISVQVPATTNQGTYLVRDALNFTAGPGTHYTMLSRGFFSDALWSEATLEENGSPTLNLTMLNVSGVLPETSIPVSQGGGSDWIWFLLAAAVGFTAVGAYFWVRSGREPSSSSGTKPSSFRKKADKAFGKSRTRAGD